MRAPLTQPVWGLGKDPGWPAAEAGARALPAAQHPMAPPRGRMSAAIIKAVRRRAQGVFFCRGGASRRRGPPLAEV